MWDTSNRDACSRHQMVESMMLSLYWIGIDQPAKGTILPAQHAGRFTPWLCANHRLAMTLVDCGEPGRRSWTSHPAPLRSHRAQRMLCRRAQAAMRLKRSLTRNRSHTDQPTDVLHDKHTQFLLRNSVNCMACAL